MASRTLLALLVVACAVLAVAARTAPGLGSETGRVLLMNSNPWYSQLNNPWGYGHPLKPVNLWPKYGYRQQYPYAGQYQYGAQNSTGYGNPFQPMKPAWQPTGYGGCPEGYILGYDYKTQEQVCIPDPQPEPLNSKYPARDYNSIINCPVGKVYRLLASGYYACVSESLAYDGTMAAAPAPTEYSDD